MTGESLEAPEADAVEQQTDVVPDPEDSGAEQPDVPLEADPADAAERAREVELGEDEDYR